MNASIFSCAAGTLWVLVTLSVWVVRSATVDAQSSAANSGDSIDACMQRAEAAFARVDARRVSQKVGFLVPRDTHSEHYVLTQRTCVGFLAVGYPRLADLDLSLHTSTGLELETDFRPEPYAYVRFCGPAGMRLVVTVRAHQGAGEYRLVRFDQAPDQMPDLNRDVGACFATRSGVKPNEPSLGPEPEAGDLDRARASWARRLARRGYRRLRSATFSSRAGQRQGIPLRLDPQKCYALAAVGGPGVIDMRLRITAHSSRPIATDLRPARDAHARFCAPLGARAASSPQPSSPQQGGAYRADVWLARGAGEWALELWELQETAVRPAGVEGFARVPYAEMQARMARRGMTMQPLAWGALKPGETLRVPVRLQGKRCYAFSVIPSEELQRAQLDLMLLDKEGGLIALDGRPGQEPLLYHCTKQSRLVRVATRVRRARGRYLILVGKERD